jgi:hypothetical protein
MKEGDTCTTAGGQSGFLVETGAQGEGEFTCFAGATFEEAKNAARGGVGGYQAPESQESIERHNPPQEGESNA